MIEIPKVYSTVPVENLQPTWSKAPTLAQLKADLQECSTSLSTHTSRLNTWYDNITVTGTAAIKPSEGRSKVTPKLIRRQAEWRYASLSEPMLSAEKLFDVAPVSWEDKDGAEQNSIVINNQFDTKINKTAFVDEYIRTAVDEGTVIMRTGWCFYQEEVEEDKPEYGAIVDESVIAEYEQYMQLQSTDPQAFFRLPEEVKLGMRMSQEQGQPIRVIVTGSSKVKVKKTLKNHPTLSVRDSRNISIDPTCNGDLDKAGFIIESFETSMSDLLKEGIYKNLSQINVSNSNPLAQPDHTLQGSEAANFRFQDEARKRLVAYEYWGYWDIHGTGSTIPFVATWIGDTLIRMELNPYPDQKPPFVLVQYLPVRKSVYGEPDGALLEDNQKIQGAIVRGMVDLLGRSANAQTGMAKGMLDVTNKRRYDRGGDYEFNPTYNPANHVITHKFPEIPQSAMALLQLFGNEADSMTGVKAFSSGIQGNSLGGSGTTSAAVRGVLDAASKREAGILRRLADGLIQVGKKIIAMNAIFLEEEEVVRITSGEFIPIRRDDLAGNYDLRLTISTAEADDAKAQELAFMLQTMGNNLDPAMTKMILVDIAKLRKMPLLAKQLKDYQPQPDEMAMKKMQLEMDKIAAEAALMNAQAQEIMSKIPLYQAKTITEGARADHIQSNADNGNLKFMEKSSGIDHARELEKQANEHQAAIVGKAIDTEHAVNLESVKQQGMRDSEVLKSILQPKVGANG